MVQEQQTQAFNGGRDLQVHHRREDLQDHQRQERLRRARHRCGKNNDLVANKLVSSSPFVQGASSGRGQPSVDIAVGGLCLHLRGSLKKR